MANRTGFGESIFQSRSVQQHLPFVGNPAFLPDQYIRDTALIVARVTSVVIGSAIAIGIFTLYPQRSACSSPLLWMAKYVEYVPVIASRCLSLGGTLAIFTGWIEMVRADRAADRAAVAAYQSSSTPSRAATQHICSSPEALRCLLAQPNYKNILFHKMDNYLKVLAREILRYGSLDMCRLLLQKVEGSDLLTPSPSWDQKSFFMEALSQKHSAKLQLILQSGKIDPKTLSEPQQVKIWQEVGSADVIPLLCQYGFNINAQDGQGWTPLMHFVQSEKCLAIGSGKEPCALTVAALNAGANPDCRNQKAQSADDLASDCTLLRNILLQASKEFKKQRPVASEVLSLPEERGWLPWRPFICRDAQGIKADHRKPVAIALLAVLTTTLFTTIVPRAMRHRALCLLYSTMAGGLSWIIYESWRGNRAADRLAVSEHLTSPVPSTAATNTICRRIQAARLLLQYANLEDFKRVDALGRPLLANEDLNDAVFKVWVDYFVNWGVADPKDKPMIELILFDRMIQDIHSGDPQNRVQYILDKNFIQPTSPPYPLQIEMWKSVQSPTLAKQLLDYGFNPNVCDETGHTALMRLVQLFDHFVREKNPASLTQYTTSIGILLHTVKINSNMRNRNGQKALDLATQPIVQDLLRAT